MSRPLFARGAKGHLIGRLQQALSGGGFYTGRVDGDFGGGTERAVTQFQQTNDLPATGRVDDVAWSRALHSDIPALFERCLQITTRMEGHGFTMVAGDFDGAGLTWGIIGFTLKHGELAAIMREVFAANPAVVQRSFGDRSDELMRMMVADWEAQHAWARSISTGPRMAGVAEPWRSAFARFGSEEIVQASQLRRAREDYFAPALVSAHRVGLATELGVALCFDVHVQNGGIKKAAMATIETGRKTKRSEKALRTLVAEAVAAQSSAKYRNDVLARKRAIASGEGDVHGEHLRFADWGLGEYAA
jgi:Putative peptidoglycan binding domain